MELYTSSILQNVVEEHIRQQKSINPRESFHGESNSGDDNTQMKDDESIPAMAGTKGVIPRGHMVVNSFPGLVHTARHTMGAGQSRSRYLNGKEGDAEGRFSDWSEVVTR
ncbi:ycf68 protein [Cucumis melo var. makuwa]|nr:ycf68 protein [Cucumis melo var. makuwa]TYK26194.1 ycf68 protein [Cucumis melo var. makuwa]